MRTSNNEVKIFLIGEENLGWSIDKDKEAVEYFLKENGFAIVEHFLKADFIFCIYADLFLNVKYFLFFLFLKKFFRKKIIVTITNDITFFPKKLIFFKNIVDIFIAPSDKIFNFLKQKGLKVYKIPFFVNPKIFKPLWISKEEICRLCKIDYSQIKDKIVIGSFQRDSLGENLKKPKWQKNPDLLLKILERLPKEKYILLLAGPRRHYIIQKCKKKIPYLFYGDAKPHTQWKDDIKINNLSLKIINYLYNITDVYIITSKSEGGPKQVIESSLTKTLVFSTKVGLAPDFLHPRLLYEENKINLLIDEIKKFFKNPQEFDKYIEYNFQKAQEEMDLNKLKGKYRKLILETLE